MTPITVITLSLNGRTLSVRVCAEPMDLESREAYVDGYARDLEDGLRVEFRHIHLYSDFGDQVGSTYAYAFKDGDWAEVENA